MTVFVVGLILGVICLFWRRLRAAKWLLALSLVWLFIWGTNGVPKYLGLWLEKPYPPLPMQEVPKADVIVILGGGMGPPKGACLNPELFGGADRVWHAARLFHAGKASVIMPSGRAEEGGSVVFLKALGVPATAIIVENKARNTLENGLYAKTLMQKSGYTNALLVTSAYHMRRAEMIFKKLGVQVVPVATDHEATYGNQKLPGDPQKSVSWLDLMCWFPSGGLLERSACYLKEFFGFFGDAWRLERL